MTVDSLLAAARADVLRLAPDVLARGPGYAVLVSLDGDDLPVVDVLPVGAIAVVLGLDCGTAVAMVRRETVRIGAGEFRVVVIGEFSPVVVVMALDRKEKRKIDGRHLHSDS